MLPCLSGGRGGGVTLLLLHGMGMTREAWLPFTERLERDWPGRWLAPDMLGHGAAPWLRPYGLGNHAAAVSGLFDQGEPVAVLGHSMGAAVAIALASGWFGIEVSQLLAVGMKLHWSDEEVGRSRHRARAPVKWIDTEDEARNLYMRTAGLDGLVDRADPMVDAGIRAGDGRYRLAADPGTFAVATGLPNLIAASRAPIYHAVGEHDIFVRAEELRTIEADARIFAGASHNVHVQCPDELWDWARPLLLRG